MKIKILVFLTALLLMMPLFGCTQSAVDGLYNLECMKNVSKSQSGATPLLWEVSSENGGKVYLFGSIHVADDSYLRLDDSIMKAFQDSGALAVECDIVEYNNNFPLQVAHAKKYMMYTNGETVDGHIPAKTVDKIFDTLKKYPDFMRKNGLSEQTLSTVKMYKPAFLTQLMTLLVSEQAGLSGDLGVDILFLKMAKELEKEIIEIESAEYQVELLFGASDDVMRIQLEQALEQPVERQAGELKEIFEAWKSGDGDYFERMLSADEDELANYTKDEIDALIEYNKALIDERNVGMAKAIAGYLDAGRKVFVIVGEAHMVGDNGIVNLLGEQGYTVKIISGTYTRNSAQSKEKAA